MRARTIADEMCIEAARELTRYVEDTELSATYILPVEEWEVYPWVAAGVGVKAIEQGAVRMHLTRRNSRPVPSNSSNVVRERYGFTQDDVFHFSPAGDTRTGG